ncbi:hypothetical protein BFX40_10665 [Mesorhizobium sp. SEMIA 3007]|uniref:RidA family protein n=1 Tax=unclassified Mesorhizobium TaxID=325217 RepID=UPI00083CCA12|nr:RidA family protein [Mesorhizobium sp. SEMIA 3007]ODA93291.1 hypothetical protein BFX40_10665 [Mesorhizobium sp. SEMIA 3007]
MTEGFSHLTPVNTRQASTLMSDGMIIKGSGIFISVLIPVDDQGNIVTSSFEEEVNAVFVEIQRTLAAADLGFEHIARLTYYVVGLNEDRVSTLRKVRSGFLSTQTPPASALIGVASLVGGVSIEIEILAVIP